MPSGAGTLIRMVPLNTAIILSPGDPIAKTVSPALKTRVRTRPRIASRSSAFKTAEKNAVAQQLTGLFQTHLTWLHSGPLEKKGSGEGNMLRGE